jgi:hypothetical protein
MVQLETTGIQSLGQSRDAATLACRVPTLENDNGGNSLVPAGALQIIQTSLQRGDDLIELRVTEVPVEVDLFKHDNKSDYAFR